MLLCVILLLKLIMEKVGILFSFYFNIPWSLNIFIFDNYPVSSHYLCCNMLRAQENAAVTDTMPA